MEELKLELEKLYNISWELKISPIKDSNLYSYEGTYQGISKYVFRVYLDSCRIAIIFNLNPFISKYIKNKTCEELIYYINEELINNKSTPKDLNQIAINIKISKRNLIINSILKS